jgi:hypothetical protein
MNDGLDATIESPTESSYSFLIEKYQSLTSYSLD